MVEGGVRGEGWSWRRSEQARPDLAGGRNVLNGREGAAV
jgi:hypothetical protein